MCLVFEFGQLGGMVGSFILLTDNSIELDRKKILKRAYSGEGRALVSLAGDSKQLPDEVRPGGEHDVHGVLVAGARCMIVGGNDEPFMS